MSDVSLEADWSDAALLETASQFAGVGSDAELAHHDRFRAGVSRLVGRRRARFDDGSAPEGVAVFLLLPGTPPDEVATLAKRVPMLDRGHEAIEGRLWFVTHVVASGTWVPATFETDDELFSYVTDHLGLPTVLAAVYDGRGPQPEIRVFAEGLGSPENFESLHIGFTTISLEDVFHRISALHASQLVTPGAQHQGTKIWKSAGEGVPVTNAEDVLASLVAAGLQTAYPTCLVRIEQTLAAGRLDIEVEERSYSEDGYVVRHAILEMKVLREKYSSGRRVSARKIADWVAEGVVQAASYRRNRAARSAALCCFDMRPNFTGAECFRSVGAKAAGMGVALRCWHLFRSAADYRAYQANVGGLKSP